MGLVCLFLACKCEECQRHLPQLLRVLNLSKNKNQNLPFNGDQTELEKIRDKIYQYEKNLLVTLHFELWVDQPNYLITSFLSRVKTSTLFSTTCLRICRDFFLSPLCVMYDTETIAIASLLLACAFLADQQTTALVQKQYNGDQKVLEKAVRSMLAFYDLFIHPKSLVEEEQSSEHLNEPDLFHSSSILHTDSLSNISMSG